MNSLVLIVLVTWVSGLAAWLGGLIARAEGRPETPAKRELIHGIVALGGGVLLSAVAFALVPEGMKELSPIPLAGVFVAGGVTFCAVDAWLSQRTGSRAQLLAMVMDFVPEAISLGAVFTHNPRLGFLLAAYIGAQNLPEGFNAWREAVTNGGNGRRTLRHLLGVSLLGPAAALLGYFLLSEAPALTAAIMSFAAGGILYLIFQDIAPQATMRRHWTPPLGAVLGFVIGMMVKQLLH